MGADSWIIAPLRALQERRENLFVWIPVQIAIGIALWFQLRFEPTLGHYILIVLLGSGAFWMGLRGPELLHPVFLAIGFVLLGGVACGLRLAVVTAPVLEFRYFGAVQGRIVEIDRSQSDAVRLKLDQVVLDDVAPERTPRLVRVSLHGDPFFPEPGQVVLMTANLGAPQGAAEPGGFDFRQMAFFDGLGAVGYTRAPVMLWQEPAPGEQSINRLRSTLSQAIMAHIPGDAGAFASGVMTGDRSGISLDTVVALRNSNLAHLLAISGMNMAFIVGFVFMLLRYGLALIPRIALRVNTKKIAAVIGLCVALFYLLLSGANVATERAFLMVTVMLGAVLLDRRALTMRSVAISAIILLLWQPESLLEPGFQLSFAATIALIAGFGALDRRVMAQKLPRWIMPVFTLVLSSVLAGAATAPFAAAHFNRFTDYGLLANLLTVPLMSILMAAGTVAAFLAPIGLAAPAFWVMEMSSRWILFVAHWISGLDGSVTGVITPGFGVIPIMALAGLWGILWPGRLRFAAVIPVCVALALWQQSRRPDVIISADGVLVGLASADGRALSLPKGAGFAGQSWLENDGDLVSQEEAALRAGFFGNTAEKTFRVEKWRGVILSGRGALDHLEAACGRADFVILAAAIEPPETLPKGCWLIDRSVLDHSGALAVWSDQSGLRFVPSRSGQRQWLGKVPVLDAVAMNADNLILSAQANAITLTKRDQ